MGTKSTAPAALQAEVRAAMIAEAAYFAAERRNFQPGHELSDWVAAEQEITAALHTASKPPARKAASKPAKKAAKKAAKKTAKKTAKKAAKKTVRKAAAKSK